MSTRSQPPAGASVAPGLAETPWFAGGLRFKCTECGKCCTGSSGSVYLTQEDIRRLAAHLQMPPGRFVRLYTRVDKGHRALADAESTADCVFLRNKTCTVYEARPTQCRTYPYWLVNIQDPESWRGAAAVCEGIDHPDAPLVPLSHIVEQVLLDQENESRLERPARRSRGR
jgi:Fe-S-cluster containining protein